MGKISLRGLFVRYLRTLHSVDDDSLYIQMFSFILLFLLDCLFGQSLIPIVPLLFEHILQMQ